MCAWPTWWVMWKAAGFQRNKTRIYSTAGLHCSLDQMVYTPCYWHYQSWGKMPHIVRPNGINHSMDHESFDLERDIHNRVEYLLKEKNSSCHVAGPGKNQRFLAMWHTSNFKIYYWVLLKDKINRKPYQRYLKAFSIEEKEKQSLLHFFNLYFIGNHVAVSGFWAFISELLIFPWSPTVNVTIQFLTCIDGHECIIDTIEMVTLLLLQSSFLL